MTKLIDILHSVLSTPVAVLQPYIIPLWKVFDHYQINNPDRQGAFLGQVSVESMRFTHVRESLNYSADRLAQIFPTHFDEDELADFAHNQERIGNRVYSDRLGNGSEESGDGFLFRGRGLIQLTGRSNYTRFANSIGMTAESVVPYLETPEGATMAAGWFWDINKLNHFADLRQITKITKLVNGGTLGLGERVKFYNDFQKDLVSLEPETPPEAA